MSTLRCNAIQDTAGVERYLARAWVNFNGTGTVAIRASGNVSSITDNGVGDYTVNFTTAMPDANYSTISFCREDYTNTIPGAVVSFGARFQPTTTSSRIQTRILASSSTLIDAVEVHVAIFR